MTPSPPQPASPSPAREQRLLEAVLALETETQRRAFLASLDDPDLHRRLEALIAASADADSFFGKAPEVHAGLEAPDHTHVMPSSKLPGEAPAQVIGRYKLLEKVGEGGFGEVWMAEQREPVKRRVALKIIKLGMDSRQVVARFEAERQALAMMDHPNIARIFDADVSDAGRPYFVMELVRGIRITDYCDQHQLPTRERLDLFIKVCQAIQHAHQKGIIHRDIKPSNILVTLHDGVPVPKVIDFGIAKATQQELTDMTVFTQFQQFIGTPAYISPEQAEMSGLDVDTRADIYSLGVLLYELLIGQTPFDSQEMMKGGFDALRRIIREREPQRPSTKLNTLQGDERTTAGKRRQTDVGKLVHQLKGDLDWIVMKCLEKDRTRRYDTANGLAQDIVRYLSNETVVARPPSTFYRLQKMARRNRVAFAATSVVAVSLIAGVFVSSWQAFRAIRAEEAKSGLLDEATKAKANEAEQRQLAERNATEAKTAVTRLEIDRSEMLFEKDQSSDALAYLARVVRREPMNRVAGERLLSALAHRNFCLPLFRVEIEGAATSAEFSPDGNSVLILTKPGGAELRDGRTGQSLPGSFTHTGEVTAAHFSPDGRRVVTTSLDQTARIWDLKTGEPAMAPLEHESGVWSADFSPDGKRLVTGTAGAIHQWNAETGELLKTTRVEIPAIKFVKFSPDGQWIVLHAPGTATRLLNAADGLAKESYSLGVPNLARPSFSRDGMRMATPTETGALEVLGPGLDSGKRISKRLYTLNQIQAARFSPDGQCVAASSFDGAVTLWDAATLSQVGEKMPHEQWVTTIDFSPDGQRIATGSKDHTVRIWEARTGRPLCEPLQHDANVIAVQFSPDGQRLLSVCEGRGVWVWEVRSNQPLAAVLPHPGTVRRAVFSPDGERIATTSQADSLLRLWDARKATLVLPPWTGGTSEVQFSRDGRRLLALVGNTAASVWDSSSGKLVAGPYDNHRATSARFSPDETHVVLGGGIETTISPDVRVWRIGDNERITRFTHKAGAGMALFSPDGRWVVSTSADKTARIWDWKTGKELTEPLRHEDAVVWADVSRDSTRVLTLSKDQTAGIWDAASGQRLHTLSHGGEPYHYFSGQFSPDGRLVVIASTSVVQIWDARTGQPVTTPLKHTGRVNSVLFSPDGTRLLTSCYDNTARLWDTATGHATGEPFRHGDRVNYAEFSPDGRRVVTAAQDGTARILDLPILTTPVPLLLAEWAEAVAGQRMDERSASRPVPFEELHRLRQSLAQAPDGDEVTRWARWFFAENATRTISPGSALTVPQFVQQRIQDNTLASLQQAVRLSPNNGPALARLALVTLTSAATPDARLMAALEWQSRLGLELSPKDPDAWWSRAKFFAHLGKSAESLEAMERAAGLNSTDANLWNARGLMLEKADQLEAALQAYTKAIEVSGPSSGQTSLLALAYGNRSKLYRRLNRLAEAGADNLAVHHLPARAADTPNTLLDLSVAFNCDFGKIPSPGRKLLDTGREYNIIGEINLLSDAASAAQLGYATEVQGIPVARKCRRLHFLHSTWSSKPADGTEVAVYRLHYADGQQKDFPVIYGEHIRMESKEEDKKETLAANSRLAWNAETATRGHVRLFETTWENDRPDVAIASLDLISRKAGPAIVVYAVTVEP